MQLNEEGFARYLNGGHSKSYSKQIKQLQDQTDFHIPAVMGT